MSVFDPPLYELALRAAPGEWILLGAVAGMLFTLLRRGRAALRGNR